jgi:hypothetical protein
VLRGCDGRPVTDVDGLEASVANEVGANRLRPAILATEEHRDRTVVRAVADGGVPQASGCSNWRGAPSRRPKVR